MPSVRTGRPAFPPLRFIVLFLCAAIFTWSLQIKLSEYSGAPVHDKIVAKLVKDWRGDNEPSTKKSSVGQPTPGGAHLLSVQISVGPCFAVPGIRPPHGPAAASITAFPLTLFSRPPPQNA